MVLGAAIALVWLQEAEAAAWIVKSLGVPAIAVLTGIAAWSIAAGRKTWLPFLNCGWLPAAVVLAWSVLLHVHFPHQFKIYLDELVLVGTSKVIHEEREVATPISLLDLAGSAKIGHGYVDKRPFFFPFLLALVHDLTGYRPANAFVLNALLTPVFLGLVFLVSNLLGATRTGSLAAVSLVAAIPLVAHNVTGGGFEILNVTLLLAAVAWAIVWARTGDLNVQLAMVTTIALLAYTRYESVLYVGIGVLCLCIGGWRAGELRLNPWCIAVAGLFGPLAAVFRVVTSNPEQWFQLETLGSESAFALGYVPKNLMHAVHFFFANDALQLGAPAISFVGIVGLLFAVLRLIRCVRTRSFWAGEQWIWALFFAGCIANLFVLLCYHWGQLDDYLVSRLSLPFYTLLCINVVWIVTFFPRGPILAKVLLVIALASAWWSGLPVAATNHRAAQYGPAREYEAVQDFLRQHRSRDMVVLTTHSLHWVVHGVWIDHLSRLEDPDTIEHWLRTREYDAVYLHRRYRWDADRRTHLPLESFVVDPRFLLETLSERRTIRGEIVRFSRIRLAPSIDSPATESNWEQ